MGSTLASSQANALAAAAWSRYTARTYAAPPESESQRFLERLLAIGANDPGQILLPTSDETAWLYTLNAAELGRYFRIAQPSTAVLLKILDKKLFADAAISAGLAVLPSWDPRTHRRCRGVGADLALSDPYKAAHACPPPQERQRGRRRFGPTS